MSNTKYGWVIDRDHLVEGEPKAINIIGPSGIDPAIRAELAKGEGAPFRMKCADGEVVYSGRLLGPFSGEHDLAPLDDFGTPDAGCVTIEYKAVTTWVPL